MCSICMAHVGHFYFGVGWVADGVTVSGWDWRLCWEDVLSIEFCLIPWNSVFQYNWYISHHYCDCLLLWYQHAYAKVMSGPHKNCTQNPSHLHIKDLSTPLHEWKVCRPIVVNILCMPMITAQLAQVSTKVCYLEYWKYVTQLSNLHSIKNWESECGMHVRTPWLKCQMDAVLELLWLKTWLLAGSISEVDSLLLWLWGVAIPYFHIAACDWDCHSCNSDHHDIHPEEICMSLIATTVVQHSCDSWVNRVGYSNWFDFTIISFL